MQKNQLVIYLVKFIGAFCLLNYGTKAIIGLTVPGGYYSPVIAGWFDYPSLLRYSLLNGTRFMVAFLGFDTYLRDAYHVAVVNGRGVRLVYACLGYGLLSFWIAFIFANNGGLLKKIKWIAGGCFVIWLINVARISLVLVGANKNWDMPITMEQHTLFSIIVYAFIFLMIYFFQRSENSFNKRTGLQAPTN